MRCGGRLISLHLLSCFEAAVSSRDIEHFTALFLVSFCAPIIPSAFNCEKATLLIRSENVQSEPRSPVSQSPRHTAESSATENDSVPYIDHTLLPSLLNEDEAFDQIKRSVRYKSTTNNVIGNPVSCVCTCDNTCISSASVRHGLAVISSSKSNPVVSRIYVPCLVGFFTNSRSISHRPSVCVESCFGH